MQRKGLHRHVIGKTKIPRPHDVFPNEAVGIKYYYCGFFGCDSRCLPRYTARHSFPFIFFYWRVQLYSTYTYVSMNISQRNEDYVLIVVVVCWCCCCSFWMCICWRHEMFLTQHFCFAKFCCLVFRHVLTIRKLCVRANRKCKHLTSVSNKQTVMSFSLH